MSNKCLTNYKMGSYVVEVLRIKRYIYVYVYMYIHIRIYINILCYMHALWHWHCLNVQANYIIFHSGFIWCFLIIKFRLCTFGKKTTGAMLCSAYHTRKHMVMLTLITWYSIVTLLLLILFFPLWLLSIL